MTTGGSLIVHLAQFAGALRQAGVTVGIGDEVDATRALTLVDLFDRAEVRRSLLIALKIRPQHRAIFDALYESLWNGRVDRPAKARPHVPGADSGARNTPVKAGGGEPWPADRAIAGYSRDIVLRRKPFEQCSAADLAEMERLLARLVPRWAARRSRRLTPVRSRGLPDLRRSLRRAVATGGEMVTLARRGRALDEPRVVVLCDTSGSMDVHVRFLLAFVLALGRVARATETFAFNTSLARLTPWLTSGRSRGRPLRNTSQIAQAVTRLASEVPGWSGGTRIGDSMMQFVTTYHHLVTRRSVVVILSDGLDRGDPALVATAMEILRSKAKRIIWLNPLSGDPRYEPTARAMRAALPFIDRLAPAHNLESLERLVPELARP